MTTRSTEILLTVPLRFFVISCHTSILWKYPGRPKEKNACRTIVHLQKCQSVLAKQSSKIVNTCLQPLLSCFSGKEQASSVLMLPGQPRRSISQGQQKAKLEHWAVCSWFLHSSIEKPD